MRKLLRWNKLLLLVIFTAIYSFLTDCKKTDNPIKYSSGTFPDTVVNLEAINTQYDDYNISLPQFTGDSPIIFSSNRKSAGGQFDLEQAEVSFTFDKTTGLFTLSAMMTEDAFLNKLIGKAVTPGNDFGPYRLFSDIDGYEYMILASEGHSGDLDMYYLKNQPVYNSSLPSIDGPHPVTVLNSASDDAYICFSTKRDTAYFTSDRDGNFDIYYQPVPTDMALSDWFGQVEAASVPVDSINSPYDDKCPMVYKNVMIFTSDRPGGIGGYDLYYSVIHNGKWSSPVNLGPSINTSSDEYRPVVGYHPDFINLFLMFSSDRPGGKGMFDLYFTGIELPVN